MDTAPVVRDQVAVDIAVKHLRRPISRLHNNRRQANTDHLPHHTTNRAIQGAIPVKVAVILLATPIRHIMVKQAKAGILLRALLCQGSMANLVRCLQVVTDNMVLPVRQHPHRTSIKADKLATVNRASPTAAIRVANRPQPTQARQEGNTAQETPAERVMALKPHPILGSLSNLVTAAIQAKASNMRTHLQRTLHIQAAHKVNMTNTALRASSTRRLVHSRLLPAVLAGQGTAAAKGTAVLKEDTASNHSSLEDTGSHLSSLEATDLRLRAGVAECSFSFDKAYWLLEIRHMQPETKLCTVTT